MRGAEDLGTEETCRSIKHHLESHLHGRVMRAEVDATLCVFVACPAATLFVITGAQSVSGNSEEKQRESIGVHPKPESSA